MPDGRGHRRGRRALPRVPAAPARAARKTRLDELEAVTVPVLIVQGVSDPFGMPPEGPGRTVVQVKGNHSLSSDAAALASAVRDWLTLRV